VLLLWGWLVSVPVLAYADDTAASLAQRQQEQAELREKIILIQKEIESKEGARKEATDALKASELAISLSARKLNYLSIKQKKAQADLDDLNQQISRQQALLTQLRLALSEQLRKQYQSGLSPLSAWLSGNDPQILGRNLAYLDYVAKARTASVARVQEQLSRLAELQVRADEKQLEIASFIRDEDEQKAVLDAQRKERATVLAQIEGQLTARRAEADRLDRDEKHLNQLISGLDEQIVIARQLAEAVKREQEAKKAEAARQAAEAAKKKPDVLPGEQNGLKSGLKWPVRGQVLARFGTDRPEGGVWRGLLIASPEGTAVRPVASGTVVYATWLRGFGNIIIVDHGQQFLSIYAYLQSMLKQVGDVVSDSDTIATVGNTGGQLDSALYFELRRHNAAVDPAPFLAK